MGIVAAGFTPLSLETSGDFDTELAVYSPTSALIAKNDDAPGAVVYSQIDFANGLPNGNYVAAVSGFNATFDDAYEINPGDVAGDFWLNVAGQLYDGALAAGEVAYVGFSISDDALAGDSSEDGFVDGLDFLAWQRGESPTPLSKRELGLWQVNYGAAGSVATMPPVPEPATALLTWIMAPAWLACRYRRRRNS